MVYSEAVDQKRRGCEVLPTNTATRMAVVVVVVVVVIVLSLPGLNRAIHASVSARLLHTGTYLSALGFMDLPYNGEKPLAFDTPRTRAVFFWQLAHRMSFPAAGIAAPAENVDDKKRFDDSVDAAVRCRYTWDMSVEDILSLRSLLRGLGGDGAVGQNTSPRNL